MKPSKLTFAALLLIATTPLALAQVGTYTQIDVPGAVATICYGINADGQIVGEYANGDLIGHGFLFSNGMYITIDYPGQLDTGAFGLNDLGTIVGVGATGAAAVGFSYDLSTGTFTTISYPGTSVTAALAVNNSGTIAGYFEPGSDALYDGFVLVASEYKKISLPGAAYTFANGVTGLGEVVGNADLKDTDVNFSLQMGKKAKRIAFPSTNKTYRLQGINNAGNVMVGFYVTNSGADAGFFLQKRSLTTLQFPAAVDTWAQGVNDEGEVVVFL
jgi:probable HAF family extracellular repeat protein